MKTDAAKHHPAPNLTKVDKKDNTALADTLKSPAKTASELSTGDTSSAVGDLKHLLAVDGFGTSSGNTFDPKVAAALSQFQTSMGLKATGSLDEATFKALVGTETAIRKNPGELEVGEKSSGQVGTLENQLKTLGYLAPGATPGNGVYSKSDAKDLVDFRIADKMKFRGQELGAAGKKLLASDVKALNHAPYRGRMTPPKDLHTLNADTAKAIAATGKDGVTGVALGAKGKAVSNIQTCLRAAGYNPTSESGTFGDRTRGAVEAFQKHSGLPVTGVVDAKTWAALQKSAIYTKSAANPPQSLGEKDGTVKTTQSDLIQAGFGKGLKATGLFDAATEKAVKSFQKKNHLPQTGEVNDATQKKLEAAAKANGWHAGSWHKGPGTEFGGDTSDWQSNAEFQASIKGAQWSAIKASDGDSGGQASFASRWNELGHLVKSGKMKLRMAYAFLEPGDSGVTEAKNLLAKTGIHGKLPAGTRLALDWEGGALSDPSSLRDAANYLHQVTGVWPVVYCQGSEVSAAESAAPHCPIWEADVADSAGDPLPVSERNRNVAFFQYSWVGGYDHDQFNGNLSALEKFAGYS